MCVCVCVCVCALTAHELAIMNDVCCVYVCVIHHETQHKQSAKHSDTQTENWNPPTLFLSFSSSASPEILLHTHILTHIPTTPHHHIITPRPPSALWVLWRRLQRVKQGGNKATRPNYWANNYTHTLRYLFFVFLPFSVSPSPHFFTFF